jgi:hypothetical protein
MLLRSLVFSHLCTVCLALLPSGLMLRIRISSLALNARLARSAPALEGRGFTQKHNAHTASTYMLAGHKVTAATAEKRNQRAFFALRAIATAAAQRLEESSSSSAVIIEKSPADLRDYRYLTLENGMHVALVSDKESDSAAACLTLNVGHMQDPADLAGMHSLRSPIKTCVLY